VKNLTSSSATGLRRRLEATQSLGQGGIDRLGDVGPVAGRIRPLIGTRPLVVALEVRTRRRAFALSVGDVTVGELALDDTSAHSTDSRHRLRLKRVEVEVDPAWVDELSPLVDQLRYECGLYPATLSKFEAGLLAVGVSIPGPPDLGPTVVDEKSTIGELAYAVLRQNTATMLRHEPGTRLGEDIEELHQMRVATRRLRAAFALYSSILPVRAAHLRDEIGWVAGVLGAVRDLDVQLEQIEEWSTGTDGDYRSSLKELGDLLARHREAAREDLLVALDSRRYSRLVASLTTFCTQGPPRRAAVARVPAAVALPGLIDGRHVDAVKAARRARRTGVPSDFHRLRIRCKRLRYALEFTATIYGSDVKRFVRQLARLQDELGLMQDADVAASGLRALATAEGPEALSPHAVFAIGGIAERYRFEALQRQHAVGDRLKVLRGAEWKRAEAHMAQLSALHAVPPPTRRRPTVAPSVAPSDAMAASEEPPATAEVPSAS
jgi:CHAD domain-containing protein